MLHHIQRGMGLLSAMTMYLAGGLMAVMAAIGFTDVLLFNLFRAPVPAANDLVSAMLPLVVVLAMCQIQRNDGHIAVDLITNLLPVRLERVLQCFGYACAAIVLALIAWGAWALALDSISLNERAIAAVRFPIWPSKVVFAVGITIAGLQALVQLLASVTHRNPVQKDQA